MAASGCPQRLPLAYKHGLPKGLKLAGIDEIEAANRFIRNDYLPAHINPYRSK